MCRAALHKSPPCVPCCCLYALHKSPPCAPHHLSPPPSFDSVLRPTPSGCTPPRPGAPTCAAAYLPTPFLATPPRVWHTTGRCWAAPATNPALETSSPVASAAALQCTQQHHLVECLITPKTHALRPWNVWSARHVFGACPNPHRCDLFRLSTCACGRPLVSHPPSDDVNALASACLPACLPAGLLGPRPGPRPGAYLRKVCCFRVKQAGNLRRVCTESEQAGDCQAK